MGRLAFIVVLSANIAGCGALYDCYEATFVGRWTYYVTVMDKKTGKLRQTHTWADTYAMCELAGWKAGDELVVCNASITNKTQNRSAPCGDFGCLWPWP
jgi:hypothetical protein